MLDSISPYALLQASKPRPAATAVTAYDLYSAAQSSPAHTAAQAAPVPQPSADAPIPTPAVPPSAVRRTHYIADIKSRHSAALRRTPLHNQPLT